MATSIDYFNLCKYRKEEGRPHHRKLEIGVKIKKECKEVEGREERGYIMTRPHGVWE